MGGIGPGQAVDKALGALYGLAIGDALGMPTQACPRAWIVERFGPLLQGFEPGPPDQPLAPGRPAGSVTDDTEQAVLLAQLLLDGAGQVDPAELARRLVAWEDSMRRRGSLDLLGPSTKRAVADLTSGVPLDRVGLTGTTNGAAMRVAPVGLAVAPGPGLADAVLAASRLTHGTSVALAGACGVAAAVSCGVAGGTVADAVSAAVEASRTGVGLGRWVAAGDVASRIELAQAHLPLYMRRRAEKGEDVIEKLVWVIGEAIGTSLATQESVPAAFACVVAYPDDPWLAVRLAASLGGDTDTMAAMAGAVLGACHGLAAWPAAAVELIDRVNGLPLRELAAGLVALREAGGEVDG
ncbi:MAG: ADP-ribosylglycohydrolase family protein [Bifidobacteriaceae bacterium]|jgi:ADP-ribosylglycohydrolase|nr:ADP-ribosylglycohydrolase family protein [Bifidobacteriaceae bacterium]